MNFINEFGLFLAETVTLVLAVLFVISQISALAEKNKREPGRLEIKRLGDKFDHYRDLLKSATLTKEQAKAAFKADKKALKQAKKNHSKNPDEAKKRLYIIDFDGDLRASAVQSLREEVTAILTVASPEDAVLVRLESPGGMVHAYGLAASQLTRLREKNIPLTVAVDKVAASGGYLMACVANHILAAPFAIVGSIGVVAQIPNFHRLIKKHDIDFELVTAGEYKRTLTLFGENTDKARTKFLADIEDIHLLFKEFVHTYRPQMELEKVATGEHWPAIRGIDLQLVDELLTSDDFLFHKSQDHDLFEVHYIIKKRLTTHLGGLVQNLVDKLLARVA